MKALDKTEMKTFDEKTIDGKITERREMLFKLRMQRGANMLEKPHLIKVIKKDMARLLTLKNRNTRKQNENI